MSVNRELKKSWHTFIY